LFWRFTGNFFKHPVEADGAAETCIICYGRNAVELTGNNFFAGFTDSYFTQKGNIRFAGMFFKITAECLRCKIGYIGNLL